MKAAIILLALLCAGCDYSNPPGIRNSTSDIIVIFDPITGCQYVREFGTAGGLTPRMNRDGKQICQERKP